MALINQSERAEHWNKNLQPKHLNTRIAWGCLRSWRWPGPKFRWRIRGSIFKTKRCDPNTASNGRTKAETPNVNPGLINPGWFSRIYPKKSCCSLYKGDLSSLTSHYGSKLKTLGHVTWSIKFWPVLYMMWSGSHPVSPEVAAPARLTGNKFNWPKKKYIQTHLAKLVALHFGFAK